MTSQKIRIQLKAFDHKLLDQSAAEIVETARTDRGTGSRADTLADHDQEVLCFEISPCG